MSLPASLPASNVAPPAASFPELFQPIGGEGEKTESRQMHPDQSFYQPSKTEVSREANNSEVFGDTHYEEQLNITEGNKNVRLGMEI